MNGPRVVALGGGHGGAKQGYGPALIDDHTPTPAHARFSRSHLTKVLAVGLGLGDASLALDGGRVRATQVLDVAGGVTDLLHLERVDDQAELVHLGTRRLAGELGELLAVADHLLDGHVAHDGAQVTGEHVVDPLVHLGLLVEEAPGRVGDRGEVVADLVDDHAPDGERGSPGG